MKKSITKILLGLFVMFILVSNSHSADFPEKTIKWLAPFGITSSSGLAAKTIADHINKSKIFLMP